MKVFVAHDIISSTWPTWYAVISQDPTVHPYRLAKVFVAHFISSTWPTEYVVISRDQTVHPYRLVNVFVAHFISSTWPTQCVVIRRDPTVRTYRLMKVFVAHFISSTWPTECVVIRRDPTVHTYRLMKVFADFASLYISSRWPCLLCRWTLKTQGFVYILLAHLSQSLRMSYCDHCQSVHPLVHTFERFLLRNHWAKFLQTLCGALC